MTFAVVLYGKISLIRVQVICGVKLLRPWYDSIVPDSITIADLFDMVQTGIFDSGPPIIKSKGRRPPGRKRRFTAHRCLW